MIEKRRTRKESAILAVKWTIPFTLLMVGMMYGLTRVVKANVTSQHDLDALYVLNQTFSVMVVLFAVFMFFMVYNIYRGEETRAEIEEREKNVARKWLAKYPELKDE